MARTINRRRNYGVCILIGLQLMCFALFLHPMSPEDFLRLAITAPLDTISERYGSAMASVFWFGLVLVAVGLTGWLNIALLFKNLRRKKARSLNILHTR